MRITKDKSEDSRNLREQAEKRAKQPIVEFRKERREDTAELIHELRVHQIELEIQNEELRNAQLELADSRNKYCELYDFAPVGYFTLNKDGLIVGANLTGAAFLGEEKDNLLKSKFSHFIVPGSQDDFYLHHKQVAESGTTQSCEVKLRRKDGTEFPAQLVSVAVAKQKSEYDQFHMTMIDITARKQAEQKLKESETRFRELFNNMSSGVAVYEAVDDGSDFVFKDFNTAGQRIDKTRREDAVGKRVTQVFPGVKAMGLLDVFRQVWKTGKAERHSATLYKDSRIEGWRENYVYKLPSGEIVAVYDDVTERQVAQERLQEERNLLRTLIDHIPDKVYVKDRGSRFIACNKSTIASNGVKKEEELIGKTDFDLYEQALAQQFFDKEQELMRTGRPIINCEIQASDGSVHSMLVTKIPLRDHSGNIVGMVGINRDITERRLAESQLQQERNLLRTLIDHIPGGIYVKDKDGRFLACNKPLAELWKVRGKDDIIGKTDFDLFEPERAQHYFDEEQKVIQTGQPIINKETECTDKSDNANYLLVTKIPLQDSDGNITGLVGIHQDITERRLAEERLKDERNLLRTLIDHIPGSVYVKDKESIFILCNKTLAEEWEKKGKDNIIGKTDFDLFEHEIAQQFFDEEQNLMQTDRPIINSEGRFTNKSGEVFYCSTNKMPLRDSAGNITGLVGINYDITERKQVEQKILEYQKHLKRLAARLTLAEEGERRRIAVAIHDDISQTLAMAKIKLDALRSSPPSQWSSAEIKQISSCIEKVIQETRTLTFELSNPLLYELGFEAAAAEWLNEQVQVKHGIATEFLDDGKAKPLDDNVKAVLFRNVRELLTNCIKHAKAKTTRVNIRRIDNSIEVIVEDNGVGFDPVQVRATAFKKAKFGLFSVRESLENIGGSFEIESKPGAGCKATMIAPIKNTQTNKEI